MSFGEIAGVVSLGLLGCVGVIAAFGILVAFLTDFFPYDHR